MLTKCKYCHQRIRTRFRRTHEKHCAKARRAAKIAYNNRITQTLDYRLEKLEDFDINIKTEDLELMTDLRFNDLILRLGLLKRAEEKKLAELESIEKKEKDKEESEKTEEFLKQKDEEEKKEDAEKDRLRQAKKEAADKRKQIRKKVAREKDVAKQIKPKKTATQKDELNIDIKSIQRQKTKTVRSAKKKRGKQND